MLYNIIQTKSGTTSVVFTDTRKKCNDRLKQLRDSQPPGATFAIEPSETNERFKKVHKFRSH